MSRLIRVAAAAALVAVAAPGAASAHKGSANFESNVGSVKPAVAGLALSVLNRDDRLALHNRSDRTVLVLGYEGEPYARIAPSGAVEVNERSPALYLNEERYAGVSVPSIADAKASPRWKRISGTGRFEWHDHRIHWMAKTTPPQVTDTAKRTEVFDWSVPLRAGSRPVSVAGTLHWTPADDGGGMPIGAVVGLGVLVLAGAGAVVVVRRRRSGDDATGAQTPEAW